jgi:hypothetical protein
MASTTSLVRQGTFQPFIPRLRLLSWKLRRCLIHSRFTRSPLRVPLPTVPRHIGFLRPPSGRRWVIPTAWTIRPTRRVAVQRKSLAGFKIGRSGRSVQISAGLLSRLRIPGSLVRGQRFRLEPLRGAHQPRNWPWRHGVGSRRARRLGDEAVLEKVDLPFVACPPSFPLPAQLDGVRFGWPDPRVFRCLGDSSERRHWDILCQQEADACSWATLGDQPVMEQALPPSARSNLGLGGGRLP